MLKNSCWRILVLGLVVGSVGLISSYLRGADNQGTISGVVKDPQGKAVDGASVQARNTERGFTVTVISQEQGRFSVTKLPPGKYEVRAWGGGFKTEPNRTVELSAGQAAKADLSLAKLQELSAMSISQAAALMPEGEGKTIIVSLCTDCHQQGAYTFLSRRMNSEGWAAIVKLMQSHPFKYFRSLELDSEDEEPIIVDYLTKNYGPGMPPLDPEKDLPKVWTKGEAAKGVVTEFDLPKGARPHDLALDSMGIAWVGEDDGTVGRLDPNALTYTRYPFPAGASGFTKSQDRAMNGLAVDPQDRLWAFNTPNNRLVEFDTKTKEFSFYPIPASSRGSRENFGINTIRFRPDGTVWATGGSNDQILRFDPKTKEFKIMDVPSAARLKIRNQPYGMAIDGGGMVWFAMRRTDKVGKVDPKTGEIGEFEIPTKRAVLRRMNADKAGDVWFGEYGGVGKLAKVDYRTAKMTEYPTPTKYSGVYSVDTDRINNIVWLNEMMANNIARFDPGAATFIEYPIPSPLSSVRRIEVDQTHPYRVFYGGMHADKVGFLEVPK